MQASEAPLTEAQYVAWRTFGEMQEVLFSRLEQHLQADSGLSNADYTVLVALSEGRGGRQRALELGRRLGWEKSRLHHQLTRMCSRGLVERQTDESRASYAALTPEGRAALTAAAPMHRRHVRDMVIDRVGPEQLAQLGEISRTILDGLTTRTT